MNSWQATGPKCGHLNMSMRAARPTAGWLLFTLAALACCVRPTQVSGATRAGIVRAHILVDAQTGRILEAYNSERLAHPASLTKLMTLYIAFQRLQTGRLGLGTRLRVSRHAAAQQPTKLWLRPGSAITVRDAILGITTRSANDAAVVLGEYLGGSETRFARMMNREARLLGMTRTRFYNASGLPNARQWTTAHDMATLAVALIHTFPQYYHFFGVRAFRFHGRIIYGHDHLLDQCAGVDGMKTGYVSASGYNIVTSAVRNHRRLVGVVLGGYSAYARDVQMSALINRGFGTHFAGGDLTARAKLPVPIHRSGATPRLVRASAEPAEAAIPDSRTWIVEVGSNLHTQHSVRRVLHSARISAPAPLRHGRGLVVHLRGSRYRARFSGLSRAQAIRACSALRLKKFSCRILTHSLPQTLDTASVAAPTARESE
jgi:D-alanyl-D-alanine carboxypeptidase